MKTEITSSELYPQWSNFDKVLVGLTIAFFGLGFAHPGFFALAALADSATLGRRIDAHNRNKMIYN